MTMWIYPAIIVIALLWTWALRTWERRRTRPEHMRRIEPRNFYPDFPRAYATTFVEHDMRCGIMLKLVLDGIDHLEDYDTTPSMHKTLTE